jgi:hypothetical protein
MSRQALTGIGQAIKANTTEKSIDQLRAEGKKRVRVVSSERVMAIIQAIVDDTINSEVSDIAKRDREGIVRQTQERFSHVLAMQQDLEGTIEELRTSLSNAELERDRLRNDKSLLESQLESARKVDAADGDLKRVASDLAGVKDAVARLAHSSANAVDENSLSRLAEKLAAHDAQTSRRHSAEIEDLRERLAHVVRDVSASRDAAIESSLQRARQQHAETEGALTHRLDRDLKALSNQLGTVVDAVVRTPGADDAAARLRANVETLDRRLLGMEKSFLEQLGAIRESSEDGRTHALSIQAEQFRDLERRLSGAATERATESGKAADRIAALETTLKALRGDIAAMAERVAQHSSTAAVAVTQALGDLRSHTKAVADKTSELDMSIGTLREEHAAHAEKIVALSASPPAEITDALEELRDHAQESARRTAESHDQLSRRLDTTIVDLKSDFAALSARSLEQAERSQQSVRAISDLIAQAASVQSDSLQSSFKDALERALDKIEKTMQAATAKPIDMSGEATDVLLAKIFDDPDTELTSNYDQLDVAQRRSGASIAKSVGRLKQMGGGAAAPAPSSTEKKS